MWRVRGELDQKPSSLMGSAGVACVPSPGHELPEAGDAVSLYGPRSPPPTLPEIAWALW